MRTFIYSTAFFCVFLSMACKEQRPPKITTLPSEKTATPKKETYRLRKYAHVKKLYSRLAEPLTKLCIEHKVPPGAILSILSLESGWGSGYVGQITGNFLSLNAVGKDPELPALYLPSYQEKSNKVLFDPNEISKIEADKLVWKLRPASLKKDYRPAPYAGTSSNLDYFRKHPDELTQANLKNIEDFVKRFISSTSKIAVYREARALMENAVAKNGTAVLFDEQLTKKFINTIGGRPNSYNFRETWPTKVISIMEGVGAVSLSQKLYKKIAFETAWSF
jgi:hypothetical protein